VQGAFIGRLNAIVMQFRRGARPTGWPAALADAPVLVLEKRF